MTTLANMLTPERAHKLNAVDDFIPRISKDLISKYGNYDKYDLLDAKRDRKVTQAYLKSLKYDNNDEQIDDSCEHGWGSYTYFTGTEYGCKRCDG